MAVTDELVTILGFKVDDHDAKRFTVTLDRIKRGALVAGAAVGAISTAIGMFTKGISAELDETGKFSRSIGVNVAEIQKLEFATKHAGGSVADVRGALSSLTKVLASPEPGTFFAPFAAFGLTPFKGKTRELKDASEMLLEISDIVSKLNKTDPKKARIVADYFGLSEGMARFAAQGRKEYERLGGVLKSYGAIITPEDTKRAAELQDSLTDIEAVFTGLKNRIGLSLMPGMTKITTALTGWTVRNSDMIIKKFHGVFGGLFDDFNDLMTALVEGDDDKFDKTLSSIWDRVANLWDKISDLLVTFVFQPIAAKVTKMFTAAFQEVADKIYSQFTGIEKQSEDGSSPDTSSSVYDSFLKVGSAIINKISPPAAIAAKVRKSLPQPFFWQEKQKKELPSIPEQKKIQLPPQLFGDIKKTKVYSSAIRNQTDFPKGRKVSSRAIPKQTTLLESRLQFPLIPFTETIKRFHSLFDNILGGLKTNFPENEKKEYNVGGESLHNTTLNASGGNKAVANMIDLAVQEWLEDQKQKEVDPQKANELIDVFGKMGVAIKGILPTFMPDFGVVGSVPGRSKQDRVNTVTNNAAGVTNNIEIVVDGSKTPAQTARAIVRALQNPMARTMQTGSAGAIR